MPINYNNIPEELRWDASWAIAGPDENGRYKRPSVVTPNGIFPSDTTNKVNLKDFETIRDEAEENPPCGIGYELLPMCGYTCIDLDVRNATNYPNNPEKWSTQEDLDRFWKIVEAFDSYTEISSSGQGLHIWVKGSIGPGVHSRDGVEVYSENRFIVCTGDVLVHNDIQERQELLDTLVAEIRNAQNQKVTLIDIEQTEDDDVILKRAATAENAEKFLELMTATPCEIIGNEKVHGSYVDLGYPSQSEADLALLSIFTFYSKSNQQCRRLFRLSNLSKRPKAIKNDAYLNRTLTLIRSRQAAEDNNDNAAILATRELLQRMGLLGATGGNTAPIAAQNEGEQAVIAPPVVAAVVVAPLPDLKIDFAEAIKQEEALDDSEIDYDELEAQRSPLEWPPGMIGALARYIFDTSPRPVKEVSIVAAIGFMAGLCGKAFCIPQSGLNVYIVLIARSAVGKEAMHSGIANILSYIRNSIPEVMSFVDFNDYASGPALIKATSGNPCFVNVSGEWGKKLKRLALEDKDGPMQTLRTTMTHLYQKSGPKSIVGGIGYSDKEKNVNTVTGVAYSMIGETTPNTFYDSLTESMMEDGFLSRFLIVEYYGKRPKANKKDVYKLEESMFEYIVALTNQVITLNAQYASQEVGADAISSKILDDFDAECDKQIDSTTDESWRQMWNRAHLKAFRLAALLAVADNYVCPIIKQDHIEWSINLVRKNIEVMSRKMQTGDIGTGDSPREKKLLSIISKYLTNPLQASYNIPARMHTDGVVPRKYLQICTQRVSSFTSHRLGQAGALDLTIKNLINDGYLTEVSKDKVVKEYNFHGKCYRIVYLPKVD